MGKKRKTDTVKTKQKQLDKLTKRKIDLLKDLAKTDDDYNKLCDVDIKSADDWMNGLPIQSLKELSLQGKRRTRLGDLRERDKLKKSSIGILTLLRQIDDQIKLVHLDLMMAKIHSVLENNN